MVSYWPDRVNPAEVTRLQGRATGRPPLSCICGPLERAIDIAVNNADTPTARAAAQEQA